MHPNDKLISIIEKRGIPKELGIMMADTLKSEKAINRLIAYILQYEDAKPEDIADEMLAIQADVEKWKDKKINEYYNCEYTKWLNRDE